MTALLLAAAAAVGFLAGSVSPATILARRRGVDLSAVGSGNPGATNAGRALGRRSGLVVGALDLGKGLVPAAVGTLAEPAAGLLAGFAAVLGHVTSPWLRGHGGKGVATSAGAVLGAQPLLAVPLVAVWLLVAAASRWVALASMTAAAALPLVAWLGGRRGSVLLWATAIAAVVVTRHQGNVRARLAVRRGHRRGG